MSGWPGQLPAIDWGLGAALSIAFIVALVTRRRGGRFRGLLGWAGVLLFFAAVLVRLAKLPAWFSLTLLGLLMYAGLRTYFFVVPVRARDRYAILAAYLAIPVALWPGYAASDDVFLATVPIVLFLLFPLLLAVGQAQEGMLDSLGRLFIGVLLFVFCAAHLGLLARSPRAELFGVFVLAAELPQRLAGRPGSGGGWARSAAGIGAGAVLAIALGFWLGPLCGLVAADAARAGLLVVAGVTMGGVVTAAMLRDLTLSAQARHGRASFLDRVVPPIYAAPFFFHYLNHFV